MRFTSLIIIVFAVFSRVDGQENPIRSIDDLSNTSVLLYQPITKDSAKTGTGNIIVASHKYFILTAAHVIEGFNPLAKVVFHLPGDKPLPVDLTDLTKGNLKWQIHPVADLAIIQIFPNTPEIDSICLKYGFPGDKLSSGDTLPPRNSEFAFFGYPIFDPKPTHFSAISFDGRLASGFITGKRADTHTQSDFIYMNVPSMQGCSGSGVYFNFASFITTFGGGTWMIGIIHGVAGDETGGKLAMITPLSYLKGWNIDVK